jgi:hypothetical protein
MNKLLFLKNCGVLFSIWIFAIILILSLPITLPITIYLLYRWQKRIDPEFVVTYDNIETIYQTERDITF